MTKLLTPRMLVTRTAAAAAVLLAVMAICLFIGSEKISPGRIFASVGQGVANPDFEIFFHIRLGRILLAGIVGAALACSGVVLQALLRNPLAEPYVLGISSGAGLGATIAVICGFGWTFLGRSPLAVMAFAGAISTVWLVWIMGRFTGRYHIAGLLLAGVVVNAIFSALIMFLTSIVESSRIYATIFWLMGNIIEEDFMTIWLAGGVISAGIVALFFLASRLNLISFGDEQARSSGINVNRVRLAAFALAALITSIAVSLSGLVGFVGLVIPHAIRLLFGPDHRQLIPLSAIAGAAFLVAADTFARTVIAPAQLPVGVVTALVGGPFFLVLLALYAGNIERSRE